jgi:hypothetical protein
VGLGEVRRQERVGIDGKVRHEWRRDGRKRVAVPGGGVSEEDEGPHSGEVAEDCLIRRHYFSVEVKTETGLEGRILLGRQKREIWPNPRQVRHLVLERHISTQ